MVNTLVGTEFITTMRKYPAVRHPIVKTNAIKKNRDYKACHALWNFLHTYTQVGVSVNLVRQDPTISRTFEKDIYDSLIWEYAMLHNYLQDVDALNLDHKPQKKEMDTQYIRQVLEEIIQGMPDMPDATLRKMVQNEMMTIQNRRKQEKKKAEKALRKQRQQEKKSKR
jgi:hypothetical protein